MLNLLVTYKKIKKKNFIWIQEYGWFQDCYNNNILEELLEVLQFETGGTKVVWGTSKKSFFEEPVKVTSGTFWSFVKNLFWSNGCNNEQQMYL